MGSCAHLSAGREMSSSRRVHGGKLGLSRAFLFRKESLLSEHGSGESLLHALCLLQMNLLQHLELVEGQT